MSNEEIIIKIRAGNESFKMELINKNMPLIHYFIKKYVKVIPYELTKDDLEQAGIIGLIKALEKYDFSFNVKFITFAYRYVRGEIIKTMESCNTKSRPFSSYIKSVNSDTEDIIAEDIADYFNFITKEEDDFENTVTNEIFTKEIMKLLTEKQRMILTFRYRENMTQQEIGKLLGIHQVEVSREESKAKRKLNLIMENKNCSI